MKKNSAEFGAVLLHNTTYNKGKRSKQIAV